MLTALNGHKVRYPLCDLCDCATAWRVIDKAGAEAALHLPSERANWNALLAHWAGAGAHVQQGRQASRSPVKNLHDEEARAGHMSKTPDQPYIILSLHKEQDLPHQATLPTTRDLFDFSLEKSRAASNAMAWVFFTG